MPSEKQLGQEKPWALPLDESVLGAERAAEIQTAIDFLPDLSPLEMADFVTKINHAVMLGLITLTSNQTNALKTLSSKCIPDAPKQINLQAEVKTEAVILNWLQDNESLRDSALARGQDQLNSITVLELEGAVEAD